jgi:adenylate cyclase
VDARVADVVTVDRPPKPWERAWERLRRWRPSIGWRWPGPDQRKKLLGRVLRALRRAFGIDRLIGLALLAGFIAVYLADPYPVAYLRLKTFDYYQQLKPRVIPPPEQKPVTIIDLDETSLAEIGQWPWPRNTIAKLVQNLMQMGAVLVAFDIVFAEPDRMNPSDVADNLQGLDEATKARLKTLPSNDQVFADVIKKSRVVLGQATYWDKIETKAGPPVRKSIAVRAPKGAPPAQLFLPNVPALVRNVPVIEVAANNPRGGHGIFSLVPEPDGIVRRVPSAFVFQNDILPSLSIEMMRVAAGRPTTLVKYDFAGIQSYGITRGLDIPTDERGRVWPYFSKSDKAKYVPAREVLAGTADPALIKGKLTILGTSAVGLLDIRSVPTEPIIPGVEVHAQLIETAFTQSYLQRPNYFNAAEMALLLVGGLLMIVLVPWVGAKWTMIVFGVVAGSALATSWFLFSGLDWLLFPGFSIGGFAVQPVTLKLDGRLLFDAGYAVVSILILYTLLTYTGYAREEAQRRKTRDAFSKYLSPDMVSRVAENPAELKLGGEQKEMTLLFCDVRGFTTISEQFTPVGLTGLINKLLTPLTNVILGNRGTVDKYMGDCIMAFWNAPLDDPQHARHGCLSALQMMEAMQPLNERLEKEAVAEKRKHVPLKIGIGLNSGPAVVGNMGSEQRFDYSCLGDTVNTASRLEGQSKGYHVNIIIGQSTADRVPEMATLELDLLQVKGKTEAVKIFTLLGDETMKQNPAFEAYRAEHDAMIAAYRTQDWKTAREKSALCRKLCEPFYDMNEFYGLYEERIAEFEANPPGPGWNGVYVATSK